MATIAEQKSMNITANKNINRADFIKSRTDSDRGKNVPELLLPSLQVNLRAGSFGQKTGGVQYVKIPVNQI
jgi:hypothetical protein